MEAFIKKKGITPCPASLSPEMKALNLRRQEEGVALSKWQPRRIKSRARTAKVEKLEGDLPEKKNQRSNPEYKGRFATREKYEKFLANQRRKNASRGYDF